MARHTKKTDSSHDGWLFADWFYSIMAILIGAVALSVNLGWISAEWLAYWPVVLIAIGVKELMERN